MWESSSIIDELRSVEPCLVLQLGVSTALSPPASRKLGDRIIISAKRAYVYADHAGPRQEILGTFPFKGACAGVRCAVMSIPRVEG